MNYNIPYLRPGALDKVPAPFDDTHQTLSLDPFTASSMNRRCLRSRSAKSQNELTVPRLPPEILVLILEQLEGKRELGNARFVSRQFEDLVVPIFYRQMRLTVGILVHVGVEYNPMGKASDLFSQKMITHTEHLTIGLVSDWRLVISLVMRLENLKYITLSFAPGRQLPTPTMEPTSTTAALSTISRARPELRFHIENFGREGQQKYKLKDACPQAFLSCKLSGVESKGFEANVKPLLASSELKTLHIAGDGYIMHFKDRNVKPGERMPPIQELVLQRYCWDHSPQVAVNFWNWTNLRHLELREICMVSFLTSVPPERLLQLRVLVLDPRCILTPHESRASDLISVLVSKLRALEVLDLRLAPSKILSGISKNGQTLKVLKFRDSFALGDQKSNTLSVNDMGTVRTSCLHLAELQIPIAFNSKEGTSSGLYIMDFIIPRMKNLRRLHLYTWVSLRDKTIPESDDDISELHTIVREWLVWFLARKRGVAFERLVLEMELVGTRMDIYYRKVEAFIRLTWNYDAEKGPSFEGPKVLW
ncbi:hypothetical protein ACLMJK_009225 [Lecanora helva]